MYKFTNWIKPVTVTDPETGYIATCRETMAEFTNDQGDTKQIRLNECRFASATSLTPLPIR